MKRKLTKFTSPLAAAIAIGAFCAGPTAFAADAKVKTDETSRTEVSRSAAESPDRNLSVRHLLGKDVKDPAGQKLGDLKDLVVDAQSGRVIYGVVSAGGVLGVGDKLHPVPFTALNCAEGAKDLTLAIDKAKLEQAPVFQKDDLASLDQADRRKQIFEYYGQSWEAFETGVSTALHRAAANLSGDNASARHLVYASWVKGKDIRSGDKDVGQVDDVLINFAGHSAAVLFDPKKDFANTTDKFVIPFNKLTIGAGEHDKITTTLTRADFERAEPITDASDITSSDNLIRWSKDDSLRSGDRSFTLHKDSAATSDDNVATTTPRNENHGRDRLPAVIDHRAEKAERDAERSAVNPNPPVSKVRYALRSDKALAGSAKHIDVVEENGKLVLRGTVATEDVKNQIEDTAEKAAEGWSVDNQITVTHK
jgi:sporulation protein YlmC with PRC-barrel domain